MAGNPKENIEKINAVVNAWETLRPNKTFSGMTLAQFKAKVAAGAGLLVMLLALYFKK